MKFTKVLAGAAVLGGLSAGAVGGIAPATADPAPWPPMPAQPAAPPLPPPGPDTGEPPAWAPPMPVPPAWAAGNPQVWDEGWQHWGVWMNGVFIPTY